MMKYQLFYDPSLLGLKNSPVHTSCVFVCVSTYSIQYTYIHTYTHRISLRNVYLLKNYIRSNFNSSSNKCGKTISNKTYQPSLIIKKKGQGLGRVFKNYFVAEALLYDEGIWRVCVHTHFIYRTFWCPVLTVLSLKGVPVGS